MSIKYNCKHCGKTIGQLKESMIDTEALGLHHLTGEERQEMIVYQSNGDISIKTICEDCQEALERNPSFHELDFFIQ